MNEQEYAISEYHDTNEVHAKLNGLISQPMRPVRREKMLEFLGYFDDKCKRSQELTDQAKKFIPGGVQHNLAFNYPFPIAIEKNGRRFFVGRRWQPIHRLPAGWWTDRTRQQLRSCARKSSRNAANVRTCHRLVPRI